MSAPILLGIAAYNLQYRQGLLDWMQRQSGLPESIRMAAVLRGRSAPESRHWREPVMLVITMETYLDNSLLPATYYSWSDELYVLCGDGRIEQPGYLFAGSGDFRHLGREDFFTRLAGARVVGTPDALERLDRLRRGVFEHGSDRQDISSRKPALWSSGARAIHGESP
jgi:hypothetical protein